MKIFIWEYIGSLTERCHPGGGLVVIAKSKDRIAALIKECDPMLYEINEEPDFIYQIESEEEKVFVFPDAGLA